MIRYTLACEEGHRFESWFRDSTTCDLQVSEHLVFCPTCHSTRIAKTIMAPSVVAKPAPDEPRRQAPMDVALLDPRRRELANLVRNLRDKVVAEGQDVGARFPEEARRIHDGLAPERQIYGQASIAEAQDLVEEGIMVLPLPGLADDLN